MRRWFRYLLLNPLLVLLLVVVLLVALIAFLAATRTGTQVLLQNVQRFMPELALEGGDGALLHGLTLDRLHWQAKGTEVEASNIQLQHEFTLGTPSTLRIERLQAERLVVKVQDDGSSEVQSDQPLAIPSMVLPFNVDAREIRVAELEIMAGTQPLTFRDVTLVAHTRDGRLQIERLAAQAYDAQGKADLALSGNLDLGKPHELDTTLAVDANSQRWGVGTATVRLGGELQHYDLAADADWQYAGYPRYQGTLRGQGTFADLAVDKLQLAGAAGTLAATGKLGWQQGLQWAAEVSGQQLNPAPLAVEWPASLDLALKSTGIMTAGQTSINLDVSHLQGKLRDYPVDVTGQGDWNGKLLALHSLDARVGDNRLQASGSADQQLVVDWQLDAPELAQLYPKIKGKANGKGVLRGQADGSQLQLEIVDLSGKVEGYDLSAKGKLDWGDNRLAAQDVLLQSGNNRVQVSGQATEPFDLRWQVDASNLANAWKGLQGSLVGQGVLKGTLAKPEIQADLKGKGLRYQDFRLGAVDLQAQQAGERYDLKGSLQDFSTGGNVLELVQVDGQGTLASHRIHAQLVHEAGKLDVAASGGWQKGQWQGSIPVLSLRDTPAGNWNLASPVSLQASAKALGSSSFCLTGRGAQACAKPAWTQQAGFSIAGSLQQIPLLMLKPWLPETLNPAGVADADYRFEQRGGKPIAEVKLRLPDSSVGIRAANGKTETLRYTNARADLSLNDRKADVQAQMEVSGYGNLQADGRVDLSPQDGNHRINARLSADMPDIGWLERFSPQIERLKGKVVGDVDISGLVKAPAVSGTVRLSEGQVYLPEAGVTLDAINLAVQASGSERATIRGSLRAGAGTLNADGVLSLANLPNWRADVSLRGNNLTLMDTHEVQAKVSPDLQIQASPADVSVTGLLQIPESTISLREIPQSAKALSDDVVIVGRSPAGQGEPAVMVRDAPLDIRPNLVVELGDKVKFTGFGLDTRLTGKLRVLRTRQDIIAEGVLNVVDGVYKAYGQNLQIERGRLIFNGPLDNPGLDVRAVREVEEGDIKVGIALAGTVQQPESSLFSTPQQTQSDTLSYLLTGRAVSGLRGDQSSLLMDAITGLGITGGENLAQQLGGRLGLDEVGLKAKNGNFEQSELALGKRLGPRLYVRYIVGLFDSLRRVAITYQINKHLQVEAQSGIQQGVDLIYKVDTNFGPLGP